MTINELIEKLKQYPPQGQVFIETWDWNEEDCGTGEYLNSQSLVKITDYTGLPGAISLVGSYYELEEE